MQSNLQAGADARQAQQWYTSFAEKDTARSDPAFCINNACAFLRSGEAFLASEGHEDRNAYDAVKVPSFCYRCTAIGQFQRESSNQVLHP